MESTLDNNNFLKVGDKREIDGKNSTIKYTDLPGGLKGWHEPNGALPLDYDLVSLQTEKKITSGWWTGKYWTGLRLKENDKVIKWKKCHELDFI